MLYNASNQYVVAKHSTASYFPEPSGKLSPSARITADVLNEQRVATPQTDSFRDACLY
jgi:hypothetical protein